jgi:hypothetical protein
LERVRSKKAYKQRHSQQKTRDRKKNKYQTAQSKIKNHQEIKSYFIVFKNWVIYQRQRNKYNCDQQYFLWVLLINQIIKKSCKSETKSERERVDFAIKKENTNSIKTKNNEGQQVYNQTGANIRQHKLWVRE